MEPKKIELVFVDDPEETERKKCIKKLVAQMICDYLKTQNKRATNPRTNQRIQRQIDESRALLANNDYHVDIA